MAIRGTLVCALFTLFGPGLLGFSVSPAVAMMVVCSAVTAVACAVTAAVQRRRLACKGCWLLVLSAGALFASLFQRAPLLMPLFERIPFPPGAIVWLFVLASVLAAILALWEAECDPGPPP